MPMETLGNQKVAESSSNFYYCQKCDYTTSRRSNFDKHLTTDKHKKLVNASKISLFCECGRGYKHIESLYRHKKKCFVKTGCDDAATKVAKMFPNVSNCTSGFFVCECGSKYRNRSGLWKHKKKCRSSMEVNGEENSVIDVLGDIQKTVERSIKEVKDDNAALKLTLDEVKTGIVTAANEPKVINNFNNINMFLNTECRDALSIGEFIRGLAVGMEDVQYALENGKVEGMVNMIRKGFEQLGVYRRPLHCTDIKRGTMYIKGDEGWGKEKGEMNQVIRDIECAQSKGIKVWEAANPSFYKGNDRLMERWLRVVKCLTDTVDGVALRKTTKRCMELSKIDAAKMNAREPALE